MDVFERFTAGAQGAIPNWVGAMTRREFFEPSLGFVELQPPPQDAHAYEWADLLEAVMAAEGEFSLLALGAGYGRWIVNAGCACRLWSPRLRAVLVAVEAEPTHAAWLREHCADNGVEVELVEAAVAADAGTVEFAVGDPAGWYGQAIADGTWSPSQVETVPAVTLSSLLRTRSEWDYVQMDVQGVEAAILEEASDELHRVRRVQIGTHNTDVETRIRTLFADWDPGFDHPTGSEHDGVRFQDGVLSFTRASRASWWTRRAARRTATYPTGTRTGRPPG